MHRYPTKTEMCEWTGISVWIENEADFLSDEPNDVYFAEIFRNVFLRRFTLQKFSEAFFRADLCFRNFHNHFSKRIYPSENFRSIFARGFVLQNFFSENHSISVIKRIISCNINLKKNLQKWKIILFRHFMWQSYQWKLFMRSTNQLSNCLNP